MERIKRLIDTLFVEEDLSDEGLLEIIEGIDAETAPYL